MASHSHFCHRVESSLCSELQHQLANIVIIARMTRPSNQLASVVLSRGYIESPACLSCCRGVERIICRPDNQVMSICIKFINVHCFLSKNKFIFALVCNIVYVGQLFMTKSDIIPRRCRHANIFWHRWSSLLNGLPHWLTTPWPSLATVPAYNTVAVSRVRAGL